ncbi:hypothetical protein Tco_1090578 [Tanacetum coccineum]|uniref:Uncharacterized protein n=1 Tax=Tanacetum coccineum TaxID=301880 RepID=A0ABQ5I4P3_9ASTR
MRPKTEVPTPVVRNFCICLKEKHFVVLVRSQKNKGSLEAGKQVFEKASIRRVRFNALSVLFKNSVASVSLRNKEITEVEISLDSS